MSYLAILAVALGLAAIILARRRRSRRALEARVAELTALSEVGRVIVGAQLDIAALAELIYQQAGQVVDIRTFQLGLFEGDTYRLLIWVRDGERQEPKHFHLRADDTPEPGHTPSPAGGEGIIGWLRQSRQPLLVRDFEGELDSLPAKPRYISADPPRSAVFVPLIAGEDVIGAMAIQSREPAAFAESHVELLAIIANQAAAALANARLYEQSQAHRLRAERRTAQLELINSLSRDITAIQPLPALFHEVVTRVRAALGHYVVNLFIAEGETLALRASSNAAFERRRLRLPFGRGLAGAAAQSGEVVVANDVSRDARYLYDEALGDARSEMAVPLKIEDRVLGVLDFESATPQAFAPDDVAMAETLAAQLAIAILEAQMYDAERRRAEHLAAIAEASRAVSSILELDELLDEVVDLVDDRFGYDRAHIFIVQGNRVVFRAGSGTHAARWAMEGLEYAVDGVGLIAQVARTGEPVLVPDVNANPSYSPGPGLEDTRTEMAVPMRVGRRLLGVVDVQSPHPGAFTPDDLRTIQTLADTLAVGVRNAQLFAAERRRRVLADTLREVSSALTSTLDLDLVFDGILEGLARVLTYDAAAIILLEKGAAGTRAFVVRAARGLESVENAVGQTLELPIDPEQDHPTTPTFSFGELDRDGGYHALLGLPESHACLAATLSGRAGRLGYLVVDRAVPAEFAADDAELVAAFASPASVAIENARLYADQREQAWVSTALLQVAEATARSNDLDEVLAVVARLTPMLAGVERCAVLLADGDSEPASRFGLRAYVGAPEDSVPDGAVFTPVGWPALSELLGSNQPVVCAPDDPMPDRLAESFGEGVSILLPLLAKGDLVGLMIVGQTPGAEPFPAYRVKLIGGIANQAALAVDSALLTQAQQEEAYVSMALLQVAEAVAGEADLEKALKKVLRLTSLLVGVDRCAVLRWDSAAGTFRPLQLFGQAPSAGLGQVTVSPVELGLDLTEPAVLGSVAILPESLAAIIGMAAALMLPLRAKGDLLGALLVGGQIVDTAGSRRLNILGGIAHQIALALENAALVQEIALQQRLEREIEVARDIQASFLPEACPAIPGWEVCAFWRAARQVGGDYYDFIPLSEGRWGLVIADVADKGVPAALYMALSRTLLRAVAIGRVEPRATLRRVNDLLLADARTDLFVTVFYAVWEPASGRIRYALGGHNPPIIVPADGQARNLKGAGIALGVIEGADMEERQVTLAPGDVLVLYTDGVTDAISPEYVEFSLERLMRAVEATRSLSATEILDRTIAAVDQHTRDMEAFDDMTLVVVKRLNIAR